MDIEKALTATVFGSPDDAEGDIDRYFAPDYEQETDGVLTDRRAFVAHIRAVRGTVVGGAITVHEVLRDGDRIADRHRVDVENRDGSTAVFEVLLFGSLASDGRLRRVVESTRQVAGGAADADLGRRR